MNFKSKILVAVAATVMANAVQATEIPIPAHTPAKFMADLKRVVGSQLKDPMSAQYQNLHAYTGHGDKPVVCGQVNSKNAYGGYTGFHTFFIDPNTEMVGIDRDFSEAMDGNEASDWLNVNAQIKKLCN